MIVLERHREAGPWHPVGPAPGPPLLAAGGQGCCQRLTLCSHDGKVDLMTTDTHDHPDNCLMCAVRVLTEGDPAVRWAPTEAGATISGVVLRQGEVSTDFGPVPFVDLWQGGTGRVRVMAYAASLRHVLDQGAAQIGDRLQVWYDGTRDLPTRGTRPATAKIFSANVQRGH